MSQSIANRGISNVNALSRVAAILAVIGGVLQLFYATYYLISGYFFESFPFLIIISSILVILGAVLFFARVASPLPWLLIAGAVVNLLGSGYETSSGAIPGLWALEALTYVSSSLWTVNYLFGGIAYLLIFVAAVLALIGFIQSRSSSQSIVVSEVVSVQQTEVTVQNETDGTPKAGWFPDPNGLPNERYWDGSTWTEQTRPQSMRAPVTAGANQRLTVDQSGNPVSPSSRLVAFLLCLFLGGLGIHRFYVGKAGTGIAMIFTLGGLGIWALIDLIMIAVGSFRDKENRLLLNWQ